MVKSELIQKLVNRQNALMVKDVEVAVNYILDRMSDSLCEGNRIEIRGFGSFAPRYRAPAGPTIRVLERGYSPTPNTRPTSNPARKCANALIKAAPPIL